MKPRIIMPALLALTVFAGSLSADETSERRAQLDAIKAELESKRAEYDNLGRKEKNETTRLRDLEQQTALSGQLLLKITKESERLKGSIASQKVHLQITETKREKRQEILKNRLRQIYKLDNVPELLEILTSNDPASVLSAYRNMKALLEYDKHLLASYHELSITLESGLKKYEKDIGSMRELQSEQEGELGKRQKMLDSRKRLVERLRRDKGEVEKSIARLEEDAREVAGIIENLEAQNRTVGDSLAFPGLAKSKGNLVWPTPGKLLRQFGYARDKRGIELSNPGIDIQSEIGSDVLAAASGEVIYISWLRGYGQFIIINHGIGYFTLYANLSEIFVETGQQVKAGELIALVGDSGSLEGPKLHFEVRYRKEQLDPLEWLR